MISVIIPAYNSGETLGDCLEALRTQTFSGEKEIIVVDDGSTDNTAAIAESFGTKVIRQANAGPAAARNRGVQESRADIVVFTDADCVPDSNWLENMIKPFSDPTVSGVAGTYKTKNKESLVARFVGYEIELRHDRMKKFNSIDFIGTYSAAYKRDVFLKFGGFDTSFRTSSGEDPDLSFKMAKSGHKLVFASDAFVWHKHPDTLRRYLKQKFSRGYWRVMLYKKHPEKVKGESYTPPLLLLETALTAVSMFLLLTGIIFYYAAYLSAAGIAIILLLNLKFFGHMFKKEIKMGLFSVPLIFLRNVSYILGVSFGLKTWRR